MQRDIPRILEAFLSFLSAVEERQIKVNSLCVAPKPEDKMTPKEIQEHERLRYEVEKAGEVLGAVADGKNFDFIMNTPNAFPPSLSNEYHANERPSSHLPSLQVSKKAWRVLCGLLGTSYSLSNSHQERRRSCKDS